jgi:3D (Asp-Asp-Asp) domain-containing protein
MQLRRVGGHICMARRASSSVSPERFGSHYLGNILLVAAASVMLTHPADGESNPARIDGKFVATAYSVTGITASGEYTHRHVVAADPDVLPIGSRIKIRRAGRYSGEYVVADTGAKIVGRKLDIYLPSTPECVKFGKKPVHVKVVALGNGTHESAKQAAQAVKKDIDKDIARGTVGNAATEHDWTVKGGPVKAAVTGNAPSNPPTTPSNTRVPANPGNTPSSNPQ